MPVRYQATGTGSGGLASVSPAWPAHQQNDVGILLIETSNQAVPSTPTGWNIVSGSPQSFGTAAATGSSRISAYWKRAASSAESAAATGDSGDHQWGIIITFRGCITTGNPIETGSGGFTSASGSAGRFKVLTGACTSSHPNNDMLWVHSWERDSASALWSVQGIQAGSPGSSSISLVTERSDAGTTQGNGGGFGIWTARQTGTGSVGNFRVTASLSTVGAWMNILFVPASASSARLISWIDQEDY